MAQTDCEKIMSDLIEKAKDKVEHHSRIYNRIWHKAHFGNNCLRTSTGLLVLGGCLPQGFVFVDYNNGRVGAYDANMTLLSSYKDVPVWTRNRGKQR
jgi:hypothetical protein